MYTTRVNRSTCNHTGASSAITALQEHISRLERIVFWQEVVPAEQSLLRLSIYSTQIAQPEPPSISPCLEDDGKDQKRWPFASMVVEKRKRLNQLCEEREKEMDVLLEIEKYKKLKEYRAMLHKIIDALSR